jgi:hypothetical protein
MRNSTKSTGAAFATAAAMLFGTLTTAPPASAADEAKVKCMGVNACKGHSACATATNACQGQNSCKGVGYLVLTQAECDAAKAELAKEKK